MPTRRMTIQELADACGLSRNTVSKVLNERAAVPASTRQHVLEKAQELGFFQFTAEASVKPAPVHQNVALLTSRMPVSCHFGTLFIPALTGFLSRAGYMLMMYELTEEEISGKKLPEGIPLEQTAGVVAIELFDGGYLKMLTGLGLPTLFVDHTSDVLYKVMDSDRICMENVASTVAITRHLLSQGATRFGFVGDPEHCCSFYERRISFEYTLWKNGYRLDPAMSICEPDESPYSDPDWIRNRLEAMPELPDAFFCANDFLAIRVMTALKQMGVAVPQRVMVAGFDGTPQSAVVEPALTTVQIHAAKMSRVAATMLINRIQNPDREFCTTYVKTTPIFRTSTDRKNPRE